MPVVAARACSCTPFSSSPSPSTPPRTAPVPNGRSTCSCFTRGTAWSPGCWSSRPRGSSSAAAERGTSWIWRVMRIARIELFELALPLVEPFIISGGAVTERRSLIVALHDDEGHVGYGESPPFELPFYSAETLASAIDLTHRVLVPRVAGRAFASPEVVDETLRAEIRGNAFARAGVETAAWDLAAHRAGVGMAQLVAGRLGVAPAASVPCGVALGIPEDRQPETLTRQVYDALQLGYRRVKIKIAPGWDEVAVRAARAGLAGTELPLTVDANGAYRWPEHERALRALDDARLLFIEQPLAPDELVGHVRLGRELRTPVCLDETLESAALARQVMELEGPRVWNVKVHRVGGLAEVTRIYRIAAEYGAELWAGTMPASGIGSQADLAVACLPRCVYPSDLEPSTRWFGRGVDVIKLTMGKDGRMAVPGVSVARLLDAGRFRSAARLLP
ncbi:MAG: o-succinylbenzoate synthase [Gemmatimonadetes bacterium]|nr:MAG: o-succinylbenzoate synthase [Gemmatimonadota bacterium]